MYCLFSFSGKTIAIGKVLKIIEQIIILKFGKLKITDDIYVYIYTYKHIYIL